MPELNQSDIQNQILQYSKHSSLNQMIQFLMKLGYWKSVLGITVASVLGSVLISAVYFSLFTQGLSSGSKETWTMAIVTPAIIAPLISFLMMKLFFELEDARKLAYTLSIYDWMTGIYNRRHFMEIAELEFAKAIRYQLPLSVIIMDLDHFKLINDNFGHIAGDEVIKSITKLIKDSLRNGDIFARYGGEEFVLLMPQTDINGALEVAERIKNNIASNSVYSDGKKLKQTTVSIGVSHVKKDTLSLDTLLKYADLALYQAKNNGRNQVRSL